ncbi:hypothetical protein AGMMS50229_00170 [Campylobacterota bacterium]|nr:hypothetical protein AGMMS50229_00170 [Campylobacterota bacterium]
MVTAENFIYFLTTCGFFVGVIFALISAMEPLTLVIVSISMSAVFYMIALAGASFFIRAIDIKAAYKLDRDFYEAQLDRARALIEKREDYIRDSTRFIRTLEEEILATKEGADKR